LKNWREYGGTIVQKERLADSGKSYVPESARSSSKTMKYYEKLWADCGKVFRQTIKANVREKSQGVLRMTFSGRFMSQFRVWAKICVRERENKHSNQAQVAGEFMRQKWRIYGLSDSHHILGLELQP
jgi:hypothetical protein